MRIRAVAWPTPERSGTGEAAGFAAAAAAQAAWALAAVAWQLTAEYYWHVMNHTPFFYRRFHKYHHYYKSPSPFDDLFIHPVEGFLYYCILFAPAAALPLRRAAFGAYMTLMGMCGLADHSGVRIALGPYDSAEHDLHHSHVNVNFGFPFAWFDRLHGTYLPPADVYE
ncbi:hypothetical protein JKP88DRAFT_195989 [Tribonema minus]|uniref:Fatty acid hydroxylase domain-containing protein n=1 Tax=Tribonema minus TaxID=303371 RepID=A0A835YXK7_9STRA|nr:hypothetical protein JKP88DRAFT_195989 [Tribonema minus]